jgi:hypothetical protein
MESMNNLAKLIKEGEDHLRQYEETKESMLSNPEISDEIKQILTGLGEGLKPALELLYEQKNKNEQPR